MTIHTLPTTTGALHPTIIILRVPYSMVKKDHFLSTRNTATTTGALHPTIIIFRVPYSMVKKSTTFMSNLGFHIPWLSLRLKKVFDSERSMATETNEGGGDECVVTEMNENC